LTVDYDATAAQTVNALNYFKLTISNNRGGAAVTLASGTVGISGAFAPNATNVSYTVTGNTVDYNGAIAETVVAFNYNNLTSSSTGSRTLASSGTVGVSGTFTPGTNTYTITGSTMDFKGSGAQTIPAFNYNNLTSSSSGARTLASSGTVGVAGTFTPGTNTYTITGSTIDFNGSGAQTIPAFNYNKLTSSSSGARTLTSSGTVGVAGTFTPGTNTYTITGSTINFNGTGAQTVPAFNYNNLTISAARAANNVTLASSGTIGVAGTLSDTATFTSGGIVSTGSTVAYNGSSSQTVTVLSPLASGSIMYNNLTINNASGVTLGGNVTVGGTLTFTSGNITTASSTIYLNSTGTASRTSGHVIGNFKKNIATGATSKTFEIGDAANYTPVSIAFVSVTTAGDLTASTTVGDHPNLATSNINSAKTANRYWTLTNSGIVFTDYSVTFNFVSGDLDSGANAGSFVVGKYSTGTWSYPTIGARTATSTESTGVTSFSDFAVGEAAIPNVDLVKSVDPSGPQPPDTDLAYTVTFTNSGSATAQSLIITDPVPSDTDFKVGSVTSNLGTTGLTVAVAYSNDGGSTYAYTPASGGGGAPAGYDRNVTNIRWTFTGNLSQTSPNNNGSLGFTARIR
jgi:hypothetical protein